jgi:hypothetical protein
MGKHISAATTTPHANKCHGSFHGLPFRHAFLTLVMLILGNMFWNMDAISFMCKPSPLKLFNTISGAFWYSFSNTNCFFIAQTTSRARE